MIVQIRCLGFSSPRNFAEFMASVAIQSNLRPSVFISSLQEATPPETHDLPPLIITGYVQRHIIPGGSKAEADRFWRCLRACILLDMRIPDEPSNSESLGRSGASSGLLEQALQCGDHLIYSMNDLISKGNCWCNGNKPYKFKCVDIEEPPAHVTADKFRSVYE